MGAQGTLRRLQDVDDALADVRFVLRFLELNFPIQTVRWPVRWGRDRVSTWRNLKPSSGNEA